MDEAEIRLPAHLVSLPKFMKFVMGWVMEAGVPPAKVSDVQLVVEEALVNIFSYAFPDCDGEVALRCAPAGRGGLRIEIRDEGIPFDPTAAPDPDLKAGLEERKIGGLGIYLMISIAESVSYHRTGSANVLVLEVR